MKLGIIGYGNMAKAILSGILGKNVLKREDIIVSAKSRNSINLAKKDFGVNITLDNTLVSKSDIVLLAVEAGVYPLVLNEIKEYLSENTIIWSIAASISLNDISEVIGNNYKVVRSMPNTPSKVGFGVTAVTPNSLLTNEELDNIIFLISSFSTVKIIREDLQEKIVPVTGSSPAMVFMFIEAMAEEAISLGFSSDEAYRLSALSVLGSAKMILETKEHPSVLRDKVCTPGGVTIEMVKTLEKEGFKRSVIKAMEACIK